MIVRSSLSWFRLLFVWHGSVLPRIMPRLLLVLLIAIMSAGARHWWLSTHADSALSIPTFTLLGVSLAIFLAFAIRSVTTALGGPQIVGWLADCQSLHPPAAVCRTETSADCRGGRFAMCLCLCAESAAAAGDDCQHLQRLIAPRLLDEVQTARFAPAIILRRLGELVQQLQREGCLNEWQWQALDRKLDTMSEILGGCERIDTTPIPYTYRVLLNRTVTIYSLLLPMGLVSSIGWLTPPIAVFIAYTYLALEVIGEELEEPFGREGNDLPLAALCHTIESAVREMQGLPVTVEAPKPQGCICTRSR
jgi:putative membrane protein